VRLAAPGSPHLTYCTNIHAGEAWAEVRANLERYVLAVKQRVAPGRPFGVGLRLSNEAAETLALPDALAEFREFLDANGLYVFTINGFPYGVFHGRRVKEDVYLPDWLDDARLSYTDRLAGLLAELLPSEPGLEGSVSTAPGAFKARVTGAGDVAGMAERLIRHAATLHGIRERTGKLVSLALEPEPACYMETIAETVRFFQEHLFAAGAVGTFSGLTGLGRGESEAALRRHLGVCFDACHMAVEFEDAAAGLAALRAAGIRVGKIQISAGLRVPLDPGDRALVEALRPFAEGVYLHQVVERRNGALTRFVDLPDALATLGASGPDPREWRIHFHVPLFREDLGRFTSTQHYLREVLELIRRDAHSPHLEVETYTWDVLPEEYRREDIVTAVARELEWVLARLGG
jgi:sugar phosphate isomerase/epimerase